MSSVASIISLVRHVKIAASPCLKQELPSFVWFCSLVLYQSGPLLVSFANDTPSISVVAFNAATSLSHFPVPNKHGNIMLSR